MIGENGILVVKSKLSPCSDSAALRQLNPVHKKGAIKFFFNYLCVVYKRLTWCTFYREQGKPKKIISIVPSLSYILLIKVHQTNFYQP